MHLTNTLRGWRKVAVIGGSLAVLAAGAGAAGVTQAFADPAAGAATTTAPGSKQSAPKSKVHKPRSAQGQEAAATPGLATTGRPATAALYGAVTVLVPGQGSDFRGQGTRGSWLAAGGDFTYTPADGSGAGGVEVGVMDKSMFPGYEVDCEDYMESCKLSDLPDGSRLLAYAEDLGGEAKRWVVEHYVGDLRVTVSTINAPYTSAETLSVTRPDPVLSIDQLTEIATQPWWSLDATIDSPYADELPSYHESESPEN